MYQGPGLLLLHVLEDVVEETNAMGVLSLIAENPSRSKDPSLIVGELFDIAALETERSEVPRVIVKIPI